ncbi:MAG TPA: BRO family protein [Planctomycetota bacterium]
MKSDKVAALFARFEAIVCQEQGIEFWFARDLHELLGYTEWRDFALAVDKAKEACGTAGQAVEDHFRDVTKTVVLRSGAESATQDMILSRRAFYLVAQNGDPRQEAIALAQSHFAVQTQRLEIFEDRLFGPGGTETRRRPALSEKALRGVMSALSEAQSVACIRGKSDQQTGLATRWRSRRAGGQKAEPK